MTFYHPPSGGTFSVTTGVGAVANASLMSKPPAEWTIAQRKNIIRRVVKETSDIIQLQGDEEENKKVGVSPFHGARGRSGGGGGWEDSSRVASE